MSLTLAEIDEIGSRLGYSRALTEEKLEPLMGHLTPYRKRVMREILEELAQIEAKIRQDGLKEGVISGTPLDYLRERAQTLTIDLARQIGGVRILGSRYLNLSTTPDSWD